MYQVWFPLRCAAYVDLAKRNAENMVHKRVVQQTTDERPLPARGMEKIEEAVEERVYRTGYSREQQQALVGWKEGDYGIELGGGGAPVGDIDEPPPHPSFLLLHRSSIIRPAGTEDGRHPLSLVSLLCTAGPTTLFPLGCTSIFSQSNRTVAILRPPLAPSPFHNPPLHTPPLLSLLATDDEDDLVEGEFVAPAGHQSSFSAVVWVRRVPPVVSVRLSNPSIWSAVGVVIN
nr:unnamed protein product [Digitaria exilis]